MRWLLILLLLIPLLASGQTGVEQRLDRIEKKLDEVSARQQSTEVQLARLESKVDEMDRRVTQRIDDFQGTMGWSFAGLMGFIGLLIGLMLWDRRTAIQPIGERQVVLERAQTLLLESGKDQQQQLDRLRQTIRQFASQHPELRDAMQQQGLL